MQATTNHWIGKKYNQYSEQQKIVADHLIDQFSFQPDAHILDVGCGDGKITCALSQLSPSGDVVGIDPSESMIAFARQTFIKDNLRFDLNTASGLTYENQFDVITSFSSLHWEPKQKEALSAFRKALKPKGSLLLAIPGPDFVLRDAIKDVSARECYKESFSHYKSPGKVWTTNEYAQLLIDTEFTIQKIEHVISEYKLDEKKYYGLLDAMLPQLSMLPTHLHDSFLAEVIENVKSQGRINSQGEMSFIVKVIEVIAHKGV